MKVEINKRISLSFLGFLYCYWKIFSSFTLFKVSIWKPLDFSSGLFILGFKFNTISETPEIIQSQHSSSLLVPPHLTFIFPCHFLLSTCHYLKLPFWFIYWLMPGTKISAPEMQDSHVSCSPQHPQHAGQYMLSKNLGTDCRFLLHS